MASCKQRVPSGPYYAAFEELGKRLHRMTKVRATHENHVTDQRVQAPRTSQDTHTYVSVTEPVRESQEQEQDQEQEQELKYKYKYEYEYEQQGFVPWDVILEVQDLIAVRPRSIRSQANVYLVLWKGFGVAVSTWEPRENLIGSDLASLVREADREWSLYCASMRSQKRVRKPVIALPSATSETLCMASEYVSYYPRDPNVNARTRT